MNYYNFVNTILETAKSHKLVYEVGEGDIYEHLNSGDHKYPCVFLTVQNVDSNGSQMTVTGSLFYVDALLSDTSNKLQIQATGMTTLQQIFMRLIDNYPDFDLRTGRYTPFDEKFADLCAGVFSNFTVSFMDDICIVNDDIFEDEHYLICDNAVIRTNYLPTNNTRVVCKMRIDSCDMENEIGVATKGKSGNSFSCLYNPRNYSSTGHRFHIICGERENIFINDLAYKYEYGEEVTFEMSRDKFIFNSQHEYQTNGAPIENENFDVHIGDDEVPDENVKWSGRVYYLRIYEGDNLVRNFIPCDKNTLIDTISGHVCNHTGHVIYK